MMRLKRNVPYIHSPFFDLHRDSFGWTEYEEKLAVDLRVKGYATIKFPEPDFNSLASQVIDELDGKYKGRHHKVLNGAGTSEAVKKIASNLEVRQLLSRLYGRPAFPFQTLNFEYGSEQHIHSDAVHFNSFPSRFMCGVWVALEDIVAENGPLEYYVGSHEDSYVTCNDFGLRASDQVKAYDYYDVFENYWSELVKAKGWQRELLICPKGTALIWVSDLLHGGSKQFDKSLTRYSQVTHYYFDGCVYFSPLTSDPIEGRYSFKSIKDIATGEPKRSSYAGVFID